MQNRNKHRDMLPSRYVGLWGAFAFIGMLFFAVLNGCQPSHYRAQADRVADKIIHEKQQQALGKTEPFSIERPSDLLRRRLLEEQGLAVTGPASYGTDRLEMIKHWPEKDYPANLAGGDPNLVIPSGKPLRLTLDEALQVAARNSFDYQKQKETIFLYALDLDLERNEFRNLFFGETSYAADVDARGNQTEVSTEGAGSLEWSRKLPSGAQLSSAVAMDLVNLLRVNTASTLGITAEGSISIPLLRGSGRQIVMEPLTQAERNVIYAMYDFERFKRTFAVSVAEDYFSVLQQMDELKNNEENYKSLVSSARRSRRLADAGRLTEIQVDQAVQNELRARSRWISAQEQLKNRLDDFKRSLSLPTDAQIELDRSDLEQLLAPATKMIETVEKESTNTSDNSTPPADAPIVLSEPDNKDAGPYELAEDKAIRLALDHRLDLRVAEGEVYDAQRAVVVAADALGAELTLFGKATMSGSKQLGTSDQPSTPLDFDRGVYESLLTLDLPLERTSERNAYRKSYIKLESSVRSVQSLEDSIKLSIRRTLRTLLQSREDLKIQARSVALAQKRVRSIQIFLEAGRAEIRDLLEAQEALLSAQNSLTSAVIDYRIAELSLQRDMGLLEVGSEGLWREYTPEDNNHG